MFKQIILSSVIILFSTLTIKAQSQYWDGCYMKNQTFQDGEQIVYKIYYNWNFVWLSAGEVVFNVKDIGDEYYISATGNTYSSYEWFFKVNDKYETYIDKQSLLPSVSVRSVHEGGYRLYDKVTFDKENNLAISLRGNTPDDAKQKKYPIDNCMHDVLSVIYYTRNLDFNSYKSGNTFPVKIFMDKEEWPLNVRYLGKETNKKIKGLGRYNTIKFSPELIAGEVFNENDRMNVWVSDDANKVPLLIESPVSIGSVKVVLKSYKGLRYNMTAALNK